jgi:murein DD-endopeptidase MepM/ murein hydrolase activator NlpD
MIISSSLGMIISPRIGMIISPSLGMIISPSLGIRGGAGNRDTQRVARCREERHGDSKAMETAKPMKRWERSPRWGWRGAIALVLAGVVLVLASLGDVLPGRSGVSAGWLVANSAIAPAEAIDAPPNSGPTLPELQRQKQEIDRARQRLEHQRQELQQKAASTAQEAEGLAQDLGSTEQQFQRNQDRIAAVTDRLDALERELALADQRYQRQRMAAIARLRFLQRQSPSWGLAVLLQSESINQFLDRRQQLKRVYEADRLTLAGLEEAALLLGSKQREIREQQRKLAAVARSLNADAAELRIAAAQTHQKLAGLQENHQALIDAQEQLAADSEAIGNLIQKRIAAQQAQAARDRLARLRAANAKARTWQGTGEMYLPVDGLITSGFGWRHHPILQTGRFHNGLDVAAPTGTTIRAAHSGAVIFAGWFGGYGNAVILDRGDGITTLYAHASELYVGEGQVVGAGEAIAAVGSTGLSTGPHLHFEVRLSGTPTDPLDFL